MIADAVQSAARIANEVIVVDGRSEDQTAALAQAAGAKVVFSDKGRGIQLHAGALAARGDILLFLHADARLPDAARSIILDRMANPAVIGGNFLIDFLPASWFTRFLVPFNDLRRKVTHRYYGDSGIFVRRTMYHTLGGFPPFPLMADYDFSARMEQAGQCVYIRDIHVYASARRFIGKEIRTLLLWGLLQTLYWFKASPYFLYRFYPDVRSSHPDLFLTDYKKTFQKQLAVQRRKERQVLE